MNILVTDKFKLTADKHNVIVQEKKKRKNKETGKMEESWTDRGYFGSVESALKKILSYEIRDSEATTISELTDVIDRTNKAIEDTLNR